MDKKELIIEVATKLFAKHGFEKTPISAICKMANVSNGLVFHHFKNKNELLREIFKKTTNIVVELNHRNREITSPRERLIELIEGAFKQMVDDKLYFRLYLNVMLQPTTREILNDLIKERSAILLKYSEEVFNKVSEEDSKILSYMFVSDLDGIAINYLYSFDDYPLDLVKEQFLKRYASNYK